MEVMLGSFVRLWVFCLLLCCVRTYAGDAFCRVGRTHASVGDHRGGGLRSKQNGNNQDAVNINLAFLLMSFEEKLIW